MITGGKVIRRPEVRSIGPGIDVNMEWNRMVGWVFVVPMRRLSPNALAKATKKCYEHYRMLLNDVHESDPFRDEVIRCIEDLKRNRIRQVVTTELSKSM